MPTKTRFRDLVARVLIVTTTVAMVPKAEGAMVGTDTAIAGDRERILTLLERPEVAAQLEAYGVRLSDAKARVAALNDAEAAQLSAEIDKAYAGAGRSGDVFTTIIMAPIVAVALLLAPFFLTGFLVYKAVKYVFSSGAQSHQP